MNALRSLIPKTPNSPLPPSQIFSRFLSSRSRRNAIPDWPCSAHYDDLINAAGRDRDFATVRRLLNKRMSDGFFNTSDTFKFIATDLSALADLTETLSLLDPGLPRKHSFDSLVATLSRLRRTDEALRVVDEMLKGRYGADAVTFHPVLNALARKSRMEEAWRVVDQMRENQISIDVTGYNYILTAYCCAGDLESAANFLARIEEEKMKADSRTYDALVLGACRAGKVEAALVLLRRMEDDGVVAIFSTHAHVIGGMLRQGYYAQAVEFVKSYAGRNKGLDTHSFGILASRLIGLERLDEARFVLKEMVRRGLPMGDKLNEFFNE